MPTLCDHTHPGTVYFQQTRAFLVVSGMCVFSVASGLFVFPAIELYYTPAIRVYGYEREDGVGRSQDLVVQGFIRYISIAFAPVVLATGVIYLLVSRDCSSGGHPPKKYCLLMGPVFNG